MRTDNLNDCNWTRTQNHLVRKRTLSRLAKWLAKWFILKRGSDITRTYSQINFNDYTNENRTEHNRN